MTDNFGTTAMMRAKASTVSGRRPAGACAVIFASLLLAACQNGPGMTASVPSSVEERHPIGAVPERVVLDVDTFGGAISAGDASELESFVLAYGQEGSGPLYVLAPQTGDRRSAELVYAETRRIAHNNGIPVAAINYSGYDPVGDRPAVKIVYERLVAATTCGQWPTNAAAGWDNRPYYNYGCATQKNFAAMLEDPRDLQGPRPTGPRHAPRRDDVFGKYGQGKSTASDAGDLGGQLSDVGD